MPNEKTNIVRGTILNHFEDPAASLLIRAYDVQANTGRTLLGTSITEESGEYSIHYSHDDLKNLNLILAVYDAEGKLIDESKPYNDVTKTKTINMYLDTYPADEVLEEQNYTLYGRIYNDKGVGVEGLIIEAKEIYAGKESVLGNPSMSREDGSYRMKLTEKRPAHKALDIHLSVLDASGQVLFSTQQYNIPSTLEVNAHISTKLLKELSEYEKLEKVLQRLAKEQQIDLLKIADEKAQQSITLLAQKSRWDARLVGMYLMAQRYAKNEKEIPAVFYYVLFRAGLSSKQEELYRVNVDKALERFEDAIKNNVIPKEKYALKKIKSAWQAKAHSTILETSNATSLSSMGEMLSLSLKNDKEKETFINLYYHGETDTGQTWENIEKEFSAKTVKSLRLTSQLGYLSFNNAGLISKITDKFNLSDPIELIKHGFYEEDKWDAYIDDKVLESIPMEGTLEEKRSQYKTWMSSQLKESYPTAIVAEKIKNKTLKIDTSTQVKKELYEGLYTEGFVLGETSIKAHIATLGNVSKETEHAYMLLDRTAKLASNDIQVMEVLLEEKLDSAYMVAKQEKKHFVAKYQEKLSTQKAYNLYEKAYTTTAFNANLLLSYGTQKINPIPAAAIAKPVDGSSVKKYPKLDALFGNLDFCTCGHCASVLSPAAYLVELLEFLKKSDGDNPQKQLFKKRPDIEHIKLSCENTNTVLPYIDLVNEVLEYWVSKNEIDGFKGFNIEAESSEELIASPKHIIDDVYEKILNKAVYPLTLPFSRSLAVERAYSSELGVPRYKRMEALLKNDDFAGYKKVFIEQLGLSQISYGILTDATEHKVATLYGFKDTIDIENAKDFCNRVDIEYSDLLLLLKTKFINPHHNETPINSTAIALVPIDANKAENCNFKTLKLAYTDKKPLKDFEYLKLVRFIRLWKHLGWSIQRVDKAFGILVNFSEPKKEGYLDKIFEAFILTLSLFERVQQALNIKFNSLLELWSHISMPVVDKPMNINLTNFTNLHDLSSIHISNIGNMNLSVLTNYSNLIDIKIPKIKEIAGHQLLANALEISLEELQDFMFISGLEPLKQFTYIKEEKYVEPDILTFIAMVKDLKSFDLNTTKLNYLFRNKDTTGEAAPKHSELLSLFTLLRTGLKEIEIKYPSTDKSLSDEKARELLVSVYGENGASIVSEVFHTEKNSDVYKKFIEKYPELSDVHTNYHSIQDLVVDKLPLLLQKLKESFIIDNLSNQFDEEPSMLSMLLHTRIANESYVLHVNSEKKKPMIMDFLALEQYDSTLSSDSKKLTFYLTFYAGGEYQFYIDGLTKNTQLSDLTIDGKVVKIEPIHADKKAYKTKESISLKAGRVYLFEITADKSLKNAILQQKLGQQLKEPVDKEKMFSLPTMQAYMHSYTRLYKTLEWAKSMALTSTEVAYFAKEGVFNKLPVATTVSKDNITALYATLEQMRRYSSIKKQLDLKGDGLTTFLEDPMATYNVEEKKTPILYKYVPWKQIDTDMLLTYYGYEMKDLSKLKTLQKVLTVFDTLKTMGLSAKELLSIKDGNTLETMLMGKYDKASWLKLSQKIYDKMRVIQRDALVSYVLQVFQKSDNAKHIDTPDKLFEYFLIDVQMDACMKTSRIKQAISSVQLFVDRCLYNLETDISPKAIDAKMWEWMKRYRVWEANRKVFLHPENWLDPSLRSTKSPFFKEFEEELLQADINNDLASQALLGYLEKLDRVSQLEICGMCKDDTDKLHVIARTADMKKVYYYRNYDGTWSPWEKITLDLEDGPVIPVWWDGRLFLFWTTILQKGQEEKKKSYSTKTQLGGPVKLKIEVNLNWSEFYNGKWQEKRMSDFNNPVSFNVDGEFDRNEIEIFSVPNEKELYIGVKNIGISPFIGNFVFSKIQNIPEIKRGNIPALYKLFFMRVIDNSNKLLSIKYPFIALGNLISAFFGGTSDKISSVNILENTFYKITDFSHPIKEVANEPFFLNDHKHAFFVDIEEKTKPLKEVATYGYDIPLIPAEVITNISDLSKYAEIPEVSMDTVLGGDIVVDSTRINTTSPLLDTIETSVILNNGSNFVFDNLVLKPERTTLNIDTHLGRI